MDIEGILALCVIFGTLSGTSAFIIKTLSDNRTKRKLAEIGVSDGTIRALFPIMKQRPEIFAALKWGLVLAGIGLALVVVQMMGFGPEDAISYGLVVLFGAAGLLAYYAIARPIFEKDAERYRAAAPQPARESPVEEVV